jgi:cytochrome P450
VLCDSSDLTAASWLITFLGANSEWKSKAKAEIEQLLDEHPIDTDVSCRAQSLSAHLSLVPLEAWESRTPVLDSIIRETLRLAQPHAAMRRNIGKETYISGKIIPTGAYVLYPFSDVHLNPELCKLSHLVCC